MYWNITFGNYVSYFSNIRLKFISNVEANRLLRLFDYFIGNEAKKYMKVVDQVTRVFFLVLFHFDLTTLIGIIRVFYIVGVKCKRA